MRPTPFRVQKYLAGIRYPARKADVLTRARQRGADDEVMAALCLLPEVEYPTPIALSCAVGRVLENR